MPSMIYHDDPDWYEKPGTTVEIPLGAKLTRSRAYVVPALPWHHQPKQYLPEQPLTDSQLDSESLTVDQQAIANQST